MARPHYRHQLEGHWKPLMLYPVPPLPLNRISEQCSYATVLINLTASDLLPAGIRHSILPEFGNQENSTVPLQQKSGSVRHGGGKHTGSPIVPVSPRGALLSG